jgi:hypothetical protein
MRSRTRSPRRRTLGALCFLCAAVLPGGISDAAADGPSARPTTGSGSAGQQHATAAKKCRKGYVRRGRRCVKKPKRDPYTGGWTDPRGADFPDSGVSAGLRVTKSVVHFNFRVVPECAKNTGNGYLGGSGDADRKGTSFSFSASDPDGSVTISGSFSTAKKGSGHASVTVPTIDSNGDRVDCTGEADLKFVRSSL